MKNIKQKKIAIIGGGPGGLTLARLLQMHGANLKLYERDEHKDARPKGATLDLHAESGLRALREAGLMTAFNRHYRPGADHLRILDKEAQIVLEDDMQKEDRSRPEIDRGPLQKILLESLEPGTVVWNSQFVKMNTVNNQWHIEFMNGERVIVDIVIGADGANSRIRSYLTPITSFYSGVTIVEGAVVDSSINCPNMHKLLNGGKIFALGNEQSLIISSKGDGSLVFYTGSKLDEDWTKNSSIDFSNKEHVLNWFTKQFAGWGSAWLELFENARLPFIVRPQYCMPLDQSWNALSNLTLIGDAAHLMPPFAGEGVNMAMLDALELALCLLSEEHPDLHVAIATYEKEMLMRASETAAMTMESTEALHGENAIEYLSAIIS